MNTERVLSIAYRAFLALGIILVVAGWFSDPVVIGMGVIFGVMGLTGLSCQRAGTTPRVNLSASGSGSYINEMRDEVD